MPDKLTDSEIVKALECCTDGSGTGLIKATLDLIYRLQAEKEELVGNIDKLKAELFDKTEQLNVELQAMRGAANSYKAENERLKKGWKADVILTANVKAEAYKELAERFEAEFADFDEKYEVILPENIQKVIADILKELVDEDNA